MPFQVTGFQLCLSMEIITCTFKEWLDTPAIYCKLILCHSFTTSYSTDGSKICIYKMSYGRRVQKSQGCPKTIGRTSEDFPSCPITRHDYQSPVQRPQEILRQLRTTWDVLQDMTTKSWNNSGHPRVLYTWLPKSQVQRTKQVLEQLGTSQDVIYMTTKVPDPKIQRSHWKSWDILGCFDVWYTRHFHYLELSYLKISITWHKYCKFKKLCELNYMWSWTCCTK